MNEPTMETLAQRLDRVERENRLLKRVSFFAFFAVFALLAGQFFLFKAIRTGVEVARLDVLKLRLENTLEQVKMAAQRFESVEETVDKLTTKEIVNRLKTVNGRISKITTQVDSLQQIISPKNVSEILTVARMKEEILLRREFEGSVKERLEQFGKGVEKTDSRLWTIQLWIWGTLVMVIGGIISLGFYFGKRLERAP